MSLRKIKLTATLLAVVIISTIFGRLASAEEGMFTLDKIAALPLAKSGLKISPNDIYNPAGTGLSVAVPRLSIGCSSEFVSPDGLILTNHHCGFDALVAASTAEKNYGELGYKADDRATELPAKGYSIDITLKEEDVTAQVLNGIDRSDAEAVQNRVDQIQKDEQTKMGDGVKVQVLPLNDGLFYYIFDYQTIQDIRVVYAPPYSIGQFGGDPDNFEWTRHGGDFTFLRAYVGKDGKSAEYSKDNVPFQPKRFLTVSTDGVKENDFTMIIGYPGGTTRYRESFSVEYNQNIQLPFTVEFLRARAASLEAIGRTDAAKQVALQGDVFSLYNSIKAFDGGVKAMRRANIVGQKQSDEARLRTWISQDASRAKYGEALNNLQAAYADYGKTAPADLIYRAMLQIEPVGVAFGALSGRASKDDLKGAIPDLLKEEPSANRENFKFLLRRAADLPADQRIPAFEKRFGSVSGEARIRAEDEFARQSFESASFTTEKGLNDLLLMPTEQLRASTNPLLMLVNDLGPSIAGAFQRQQQLGAKIGQNRLLYTQAMIAMKGTTPYPDANFTQRFTYGTIKGYTPREAEVRSPLTTLDGVFEKDTGRAPFNSPAKLRDLWQRKDFGVYGVNGSVPVDFLSTDDIIGGNSGSPVMNGSGELIGIAFDGNYEGLGNDFFFNPALGRTISVDIRYVLFITEKFGNAGWILKEMNIKGRAKPATAGE
ncbi:MAG: S46 family peptidase [Acidobacteriota bacterium]|nr:S46 family peptidase [Acidobacteriota bacterium]